MTSIGSLADPMEAILLGSGFTEPTLSPLLTPGLRSGSGKLGKAPVPTWQLLAIPGL